MSSGKIPSCIEWYNPQLPIHRDEITTVERILGIEFPPLYVECVLTHNGAYVHPKDVDVPGRGLSVLSFLLSLSNRHREGQYMLDTVEAIRDRLRTGVVPFGADPFGNYFCFDFADSKVGEPAIVFWDHEHVFHSPEAGIFSICTSFTDLLRQLHNSIDDETDAWLRQMAIEAVKQEKSEKRET